MTTRIYKASKNQSGRRGWSVTFNHPLRRDGRGNYGLQIRRGLGTRDNAEADRLVEQLNTLLADQSWWSLDRRAEAALQFESVVVSAFFDDIEGGKNNSRGLRHGCIPLPPQGEGYARVMLVGTTGAGKTTLLRQLIGSDHKRDRFPSTSTAKTTTCDIEIIMGPGPFEAAVTFMSEHEVRCAVEECLEEACMGVIRGFDDSGIAGALLEHREQRFRLSYPLGAWQQSDTTNRIDNQYEMGYEYEAPEMDTLPVGEAVGLDDVAGNNERLRGYVARIREITMEVRERVAEEQGDFQDMDNANQRQDWQEDFTNALYENQDFSRLSLDIMEVIQDRFDLIEAGRFERGATAWPKFWYCHELDRGTFLKHVRWFTSNHKQQFGRLLTPLVDGIRVRGDFQPARIELRDENRRLVLLDGEGLGHSAKEATSVSTRVTEKFSETDMILLVDNAESPMQAAPLELLRSVGNGGHVHKLAVAFTHFDQVRGDNLSEHQDKQNHVRASIGNAVASLRESLGPLVTETLERRLAENDFYLSYLDQPVEKIPRGFIGDMKTLLDRMQQSAESVESVMVGPIYQVARLELALRDASDGFKQPWLGRLGLSYHDGVPKEHWGRVKALCRRIANSWRNEYNGLKPVADLVRQLQTSISLWLDNPSGWTRQPESEDERQEAIDAVRRRVSDGIHSLAERRLITSHRSDWRTAFGFSGTGSSTHRARRMAQIYDSAAPSITSVMDIPTKEFLDEVIELVCAAVSDVGGWVEGVRDRQTVDVA